MQGVPVAKKSQYLWSHRRRLGYVFGFTLTGITILVLMLPATANMNSPGPMNVDHEDVKCESCHKPTTGTLRQKLQANINYLLGGREKLIALGRSPVNSENCLRCHNRPKDRHPVFRFYEPRYAKARLAIQPHYCTSCHHEHTGTRVSVKMTFCSHCHQSLKIRNDPISTSHEELVKKKNWRSCLGCHDYHGNHRIKLATELQARWSESLILEYFEGGKSLYSGEKIFKAKNDE